MRTRRLPDRILNQRGEECRQQISPWVSTQGRVYYGLGPDSDGQSTGVLLRGGAFFNAHVTIPSEREMMANSTSATFTSRWSQSMVPHSRKVGSTCISEHTSLSHSMQ